MLEFAYKYLENVIYYREELYTALGETIIMVFIAGIISTLIGIILGIALAVTKKNGILENSIVVVQNIFSKEGITYFFSNIITNFCSMEPFILLILSYFAVSIAKSSGIIKRKRKSPCGLFRFHRGIDRWMQD